MLPESDHRWQSARAHLHAMASDNRLARAPFADEAGLPTFSEASKFRTRMPASVSAALEASVMGFRGSQDIDEPVSWMPSIDAVGLEVEVSSSNEGSSPRARPTQSAVDAGQRSRRTPPVGLWKRSQLITALPGGRSGGYSRPRG